MTITNETNRVQFAGSGTTGPFNVSTLEAQNSGQLLVTKTDTGGTNSVLVITTDYTVDSTTENVTLVSNLAVGETLTVTLNIPLTQGVDYKNTGSFDAEVNEDALDKLTLINKAQQEELARCIKLEVDATATDITIPDANTGKALLWASDGNLENSTDNFNTIVTDATTQATNAATSASNAATSETNAATSASNASTSETNASTSASNASTSETNAATSETNAATSEANAESAAGATAIYWNFDSTTTMADPGTSDLRFNNATISSVTQIAVSANTLDTGTPDVSDFIATWDDSTSTTKAHLTIRKRGTPATFAVFTIGGTITDNTTWLQIPVTYIDGNGTISNNDDLYVQFSRTGDAGSSVSIATPSEINTGTDNVKVISPDGLAGSNYGKVPVTFTVAGISTSVATGDGQGYFHIPAELNGMDLVDLEAFVVTAGTTSTTDIQISNTTQAVDMLSTKLTIDSGETNSSTAATPAVIDTANDDVATGDVIEIDIDAVSTTAPQGLEVILYFQLP